MIQPKVVPVVLPSFDWQGFVSEAHASLGRSPTSSLDGAGLAPGSIKTAIAALGEFQHPGTAPIPYIRSRACDKALELLSITFLVDTTTEALFELLKLGKLTVFPADAHYTQAVALVSGTLRQWREVLIEGSHPLANSCLRATLTQVLRHLIEAGLGDLFHDQRMAKQRDGTVALESKKP